MSQQIAEIVESAPFAAAHVWTTKQGAIGFAYFDTLGGLRREDDPSLKHVRTAGDHTGFVSQGAAERVITAAMQGVTWKTAQVEKTETGRFGRKKVVQVPQSVRQETPITIGKVMGTTDNIPAHVVGYDFLSRTSATQNLYRDGYGRPGRTLTTAVVLREHEALELTDLLHGEPRLAREMAKLVLQTRLGFSAEDMPMPDYEELDRKMTFVHFATSALHGVDKGELVALD